MNESSACEPLVFGPMAEGDATISGGTFDMPGWAWSCSCRAAGRGYPDERSAEAAVDEHLAAAASRITPDQENRTR